MIVEERQYQLDCIEAVFAALRQFSKVLISVPTGGGKTVIFSLISESLVGQGKRILILAHRDELIDQAILEIFEATGIVAEKEKAEWEATLRAPIVVASVQTMVRRLPKWPADHFELVVLDEAHHILSPMWLSVANHFSAGKLGVTATPHRGDQQNLGDFFENVAYEIPMISAHNEEPLGLINQGFLCPIVIRSEPIKIKLEVKDENGQVKAVGSESSDAGKDFDKNHIAMAIEPYLDEIAVKIAEHAGMRRTLAFLPLIKTSHKFVESCRKAGINAEHIDGLSEDRKEKLRRFKNWEFDLLSNAMLLSEGFNDPGINCIVVLRPTQSQPLYAQMVGRGTRNAFGKENLLLLDFLWMHERYEIVRPAHLIARDKIEADCITAHTQAAGLPAGIADGLSGEVDLVKAVSDVAAEREEALRKALERQQKKESTTVSPGQFALDHESVKVADYEPITAVDKMPPTQDQMEWLKKIRVHPKTHQIYLKYIPKDIEPQLKKLDWKAIRTRGQATKILNIAFNKKWEPLILASPSQRAQMKRLGHPNPEHATAQAARQFFAEMRRRAKEPQLQ